MRASVLACKKNLVDINDGKAISEQKFVGIHLSPFNKFIFLNALRVKLKKNTTDAMRTFRYVWTNSNGITLLRENEGSPIVRIDSIDALRSLGITLDESAVADM